MGFPDSSVGKESTCNVGDPGLIPVLERSAGDIEPESSALQADSLSTEPPGNRNRNRVQNKWTALETSQNLPPPVCQKIDFQKHNQGQGRNFKCTHLSQFSGLGRC